jgi:hypothetical protein
MGIQVSACNNANVILIVLSEESHSRLFYSGFEFHCSGVLFQIRRGWTLRIALRWSPKLGLSESFHLIKRMRGKI